MAKGPTVVLLCFLVLGSNYDKYDCKGNKKVQKLAKQELEPTTTEQPNEEFTSITDAAEFTTENVEEIPSEETITEPVTDPGIEFMTTTTQPSIINGGRTSLPSRKPTKRKRCRRPFYRWAIPNCFYMKHRRNNDRRPQFGIRVNNRRIYNRWSVLEYSNQNRFKRNQARANCIVQNYQRYRRNSRNFYNTRSNSNNNWYNRDSGRSRDPWSDVIYFVPTSYYESNNRGNRGNYNRRRGSSNSNYDYYYTNWYYVYK